MSALVGTALASIANEKIESCTGACGLCDRCTLRAVKVRATYRALARLVLHHPSLLHIDRQVDPILFYAFERAKSAALGYSEVVRELREVGEDCECDDYDRCAACELHDAVEREAKAMTRAWFRLGERVHEVLFGRGMS